MKVSRDGVKNNLTLYNVNIPAYKPTVAAKLVSKRLDGLIAMNVDKAIIAREQATLTGIATKDIEKRLSLAEERINKLESVANEYEIAFTDLKKQIDTINNKLGTGLVEDGDSKF